MLSVSLLVLLCVAFGLPGQSLAQINATSVDDAVLKVQELANIVRFTAKKQFPPTADAQAEVDNLLDTMDQALNHCATELRQTNSFEKYETCTVSVVAGARQALDEEAGMQWAIYGATSGASRMGLFLWSESKTFLLNLIKMIY
ncbi:uncharacterized protein Dwil_GK28302 [Drosophila willistoni]|uniref:Protein TsetseEP domain-containing protein n=1 Tax=Drosophila willistoni TaxID=7260 RepID=A0A0Q9X1K0_DROWI|nr:uncharacterized protein LOC26530304 [Drosophila willistoni]KRF99753.1 uncharacterized protein Dwil_GK28302 [Drosophila willistoni]